MTAFRYKALNQEGKLVKGVLEGDSDRQVRGTLRQRHLRPVEVAEAAESLRVSERGRFQLFSKRLGAGDLALITRQLATLIASALPLDECLQAVADQSRKSSIKSMMLQVRSKVAEGHTLAHALNQFPQAFGEMYRAMVNAGEEAGQLAPVLEQLAHYTETRQHTAQKLQMALIYPFVLIAVAVAVVTALMIFVVPELVGIFAHTKKALPPLTVGLIWTSDFMRDYALLSFVVLIGIVWASRRALQHPGRKKRWHQSLLRIPGLRGVLIALDTNEVSIEGRKSFFDIISFEKLSSISKLILFFIEPKFTSTNISSRFEFTNQVPDAFISILPDDFIEVLPPAA